MIVVLCGAVSFRFPVQAKVLVLLVDAVKLCLELLNASALCLQELGLVLNYIIELQEVFHGPARAVWI